MAGGRYFSTSFHGKRYVKLEGIDASLLRSNRGSTHALEVELELAAHGRIEAVEKLA